MSKAKGGRGFEPLAPSIPVGGRYGKNYAGRKEVRTMGYTHYWRRRREYAPGAFSPIVADFRKLLPYLKEAGIGLAGGFGEGEPKVTEEEVWFNGLENCGHAESDLGITWPAAKARGVSLAVAQSSAPPVTGHWFAGALLGSRSCGGDCSHETLYFPRVRQPHEWEKEPEKGGFYFDFCKTAYKPYDLAVTAFLIIAKHHLGDEIRVSSDGDRDQWQDTMRLCETVLGYGYEFALEED